MNTTLLRLSGKSLTRADILKVVRSKIGEIDESDHLIDDIAWAMDINRTEPMTYTRGQEVFTVSCGCIITTP